MFVAVNSPWSANDQGEPLIIMVEAEDRDAAPNVLGQAIAMEAHLHDESPSEEDIEALLSTIQIFE